MPVTPNYLLDSGRIITKGNFIGHMIELLATGMCNNLEAVAK